MWSEAYAVKVLKNKKRANGQKILFNKYIDSSDKNLIQPEFCFESGWAASHHNGIIKRTHCACLTAAYLDEIFIEGY